MEKIKSMHLRFLESQHARLKAKKEASGCRTWEEWILKIAEKQE